MSSGVPVVLGTPFKMQRDHNCWSLCAKCCDKDIKKKLFFTFYKTKNTEKAQTIFIEFNLIAIILT